MKPSMKLTANSLAATLNKFRQKLVKKTEDRNRPTPQTGQGR